MLTFFYIAILLVLIVITIQDFRFRAISWITIPLLFGFIVSRSLLIADSKNVLTSTFQNWAFLIFQMLFLIVYFSIRNKKFEPVIQSFIGWGDILFFIAIAPALCFGNFLLFIVLSILFILLFYVITQALRFKSNPQIPLAGIQSLFLILWLGIEWLVDPSISFTYLPAYFAN